MSGEGLDAVELRTVLIACLLFAMVLCCVVRTEPPDVDDDIEHNFASGEGMVDPKTRALVVNEHLESHEFTVENSSSSGSSLGSQNHDADFLESSDDNDGDKCLSKQQNDDDDEEHCHDHHHRCDTETEEHMVPRDQDEEGKGDQCAICMENFAEGVAVSTGLCQHQFHYSCIASWLCKNTGCPMCREIFLKVDLPNESKEQQSTTNSSQSTFEIELGSPSLDQIQSQEGASTLDSASPAISTNSSEVVTDVENDVETEMEGCPEAIDSTICNESVNESNEKVHKARPQLEV